MRLAEKMPETWRVDNSRDTATPKEASKAADRGQEWEETFDTISDAITIHDGNFRIVRANRAARELLGASMDEILSRPCYRIYHGTDGPPAGCPSCAALRKIAPCKTEIFEPHLQKWLEIRALPRFDKTGTAVGLVHVVRDISGRKEAEKKERLLQAQVQEAQKMESLGRLAGGVAHDFNNILFAILGYCELSQGQLPPEHPVQGSLGTIHESAERAAALVRQLLSFSRRQTLELKQMELGVLVAGLEEMLRRIVGEKVALRVRRGAAAAVIADARRLEQVLLNLVVNACDAISESGGITVSTGTALLSPADPRLPDGEPEGRWGFFSVADTGDGIDEGLRDRIFEPFFTTKEVGRGTGLGLATAFGIVRQHGGFFHVGSRPGEGAVMEVFLPLSAREEAQPATAPGKRDTRGGGETILIAEDDTSVRQIILEVLCDLGYRVLEAADGEEALRLLGEHRGRIDLLLTDVIMPQMNGGRLANFFLECYPGRPVIFMSGYTDDILEKNGGVAREATFLQKPLSPGLLAATVREVLDGRCEISG